MSPPFIPTAIAASSRARRLLVEAWHHTPRDAGGKTLQARWAKHPVAARVRAHAGSQRLNHRWALGGLTRHLPGGRTVSIVDAATCWAGEDVALIILRGGGRTHRSNLIGIGVLRLLRAAGNPSSQPDPPNLAGQRGIT